MRPMNLHLRGTVILNHVDVASDAWVADGRLWLEPPPGFLAEAELSGWFLPGLVDMHCHIGLGLEGVVSQAQARAQAIADRDSGVLLVRDGGTPSDTLWMDEDPALPRVVRAGRHIARPRRYIRHYANEVEPGDLVAEVERQARVGNSWVKIVADWIDRDLGDLAPLWDGVELADAVSMASELGVRVMAHAFGREALEDLIAAGVDSIEHATGADEDLAKTIARNGQVVVPTMIQRGNFAEIANGAGKYPRFVTRMNSMHSERYDHLAMLRDCGVRLLAGTDAGGTIGHGLMMQELSQWAVAGLPAAEIVRAATSDGHEFLGSSGLSHGARADIIGMDRDPREDLGALTKSPIRVIVGGCIAR